MEWVVSGGLRVHSRQIGLKNLSEGGPEQEGGGNDSRTRGLVSWFSEVHLICWSGFRITEGTAAYTWGLGVSPGGRNRKQDRKVNQLALYSIREL